VTIGPEGTCDGRWAKQECPLRVLDTFKVQHSRSRTRRCRSPSPARAPRSSSASTSMAAKRQSCVGAHRAQAGQRDVPRRGSTRCVGKSVFEPSSTSRRVADAAARGDAGGGGAAQREREHRGAVRHGSTPGAAGAGLRAVATRGLLGAGVPAGGSLWSRLTVNGKPQGLSVKAELQGSDIRWRTRGRATSPRSLLVGQGPHAGGLLDEGGGRQRAHQRLAEARERPARDVQVRDA